MELPFARFFLSKMKGLSSRGILVVTIYYSTMYICMYSCACITVSDLRFLDEQLYKNLIFLKTYEGDVADLGLTFSYVDNGM